MLHTPNSPRSALIIVDVQQSFMHMPYWPQGDITPFRQALLKLEVGCRKAHVPVVHIFHIDGDGPFQLASGHVCGFEWLPSDPAVTVIKHTHNAFTDTGLDLWLRRQGVQHLIICGIRTEQCCETTARVGSDLGYSVDFVTEATLTFPMTSPVTGQTFSAQDIATRTELVLSERFARIVTVDACLASL